MWSSIPVAEGLRSRKPKGTGGATSISSLILPTAFSRLSLPTLYLATPSLTLNLTWSFLSSALSVLIRPQHWAR